MRLAGIVADCQAFLSLARRTPGWEELFGIAVVEAMAAGVPCVAHDHVGPAGIIRHGQDGFLVAEGDTYAVNGWIRLLKDEPERWQAVADAAAETARRYSMASVSRQWRDVLTSGAAPPHVSVLAPPHEPLPRNRPMQQAPASSC